MEAGEKYVYSHDSGHGFGEAARVAAEGGELSAEMKELDLKDGMEVEFLQLDDAGWPLIQWVDGVGIDRITAIDPELFESNFHPAGGEAKKEQAPPRKIKDNPQA